jgi:hypothetical protein
MAALKVVMLFKLPSSKMAESSLIHALNYIWGILPLQRKCLTPLYQDNQNQPANIFWIIPILILDGRV